MIPKDVRLYTWVDVEEVLLRALHEGRWPEWLVWARPYWDTLTVGVRSGRRGDAYRWLAAEYEPRYDSRADEIILESLNDERRTLPVVVEETAETPPSPRFVPTFTRPAVLWASSARMARPRRLSPELPPVAWTAVKAGVLANQTVDSLHQAARKTLSDALEPIWGKKLGSDRSKEARSSEWVISALSDFRQQIQARDLMRLLALAAQGSVGDSHWKDRLLTPGALRRALPDCSTEKTKEVEAENPLLRPVFEYLRNLPGDRRTVPFTRETVGLEPDQLRLLEDNGVVLREGDEYYMPEIFRHGLHFKLESGARPRVLTLARRARVNV